jgi:hypothetical protein
MAVMKLLVEVALLLFICGQAEDTTHAKTTTAADDKGISTVAKTTSALRDTTTSVGTTTITKGTTVATQSTTVATKDTSAPKGSTPSPQISTTASSSQMSTTADDTTISPPKTTAVVQGTTTPLPKTSTVAQGTTAGPSATHMNILKGKMALSVSDVAAFETDARVVPVLAESMASLLELPKEHVQILSLAPAQRRLKANAAKGILSFEYKITDSDNKIAAEKLIRIAPQFPATANKNLDAKGIAARVATAQISAPTKTTVPISPCATFAPPIATSTTVAPPLATSTTVPSNPCAKVTPPVSTTVSADPCQVLATSPSSTTAAKSSDHSPVEAAWKHVVQQLQNPGQMSSKTKMEIAAAAGSAGAAAIAGTAIAVASHEMAEPSTTVRVTPKPRLVVVEVGVPVTPVPREASLMYDDSDKKPVAAVVNAGARHEMLLGAAAFLCVGAFLIGVSGLVYCRVSQRKRASQSHAFTELAAAEEA